MGKKRGSGKGRGVGGEEGRKGRGRDGRRGGLGFFFLRALGLGRDLTRMN